MSDEYQATLADLNEALLGDEQAGARIAQRLTQPRYSEQQLEAARQQALAESQAYRTALSKIEYERRLRAYARQNGLSHVMPGEKESESDFVAAAAKRDEQLRARFPDMDEVERSARALEETAAKLGPVDEADNKAYFAERRRRADPFAERNDQMQFNEEGDDEGDEESQRNHEDVQAMIANRRQQQADLAAAATARRNPEPRRIRRYSDQ